MAFYVYILASGRNGTLYTGMTDDIARRTWEHHEGLRPEFTSRHGVKTLVRYELQDSRESAFLRERRVKSWNRLWKLELIEKSNPGWCDLSVGLVRAALARAARTWVPASAGMSGRERRLRCNMNAEPLS